MGSANPETTIMEVMNRPRSTGPALASYDENSSPPQCANSALGRGASTNVSAVGCGVMDHEPPDNRLAGLTDQEREPVRPKGA